MGKCLSSFIWSSKRGGKEIIIVEGGRNQKEVCSEISVKERRIWEKAQEKGILD